MKCALELVATATIRAEEIARAKEEQERAYRERIRTRTIEYCERLGEQLETLADNGKTPTLYFYCDSSNYVLTPTYKDYADGRLSYKISNYTPINLHDLCNWFADYCFNVEVENFKYQRYGCGECSGKKITISPSPVCLE